MNFLLCYSLTKRSLTSSKILFLIPDRYGHTYQPGIDVNIDSIVGWFPEANADGTVNYHGFIRSSSNSASRLFSGSFTFGGLSARFSSNGFTQIDVSPQPNDTYVLGINNYGDIVGYYYCSITQNECGFIRSSKGNVTTVVYPNSNHTALTGISDDGTTIGNYRIDNANDQWHSFMRAPTGAYVAIDPESDDLTAQVSGIDSIGEIVGWYWGVHYTNPDGNNRRTFLRSPTGLYAIQSVSTDEIQYRGLSGKYIVGTMGNTNSNGQFFLEGFVSNCCN